MAPHDVGRGGVRIGELFDPKIPMIGCSIAAFRDAVIQIHFYSSDSVEHAGLLVVTYGAPILATQMDVDRSAG